MVSQCSGQMRVGMFPVGLDFGAIIRFAELTGATQDPLAADLLADTLPVAEAAILRGIKSED